MKARLAALLAALLALSPLCPMTALAAGGEGVRIAIIDTGISTRSLEPSRVEAGRNFVFPEGDTDDRVGHGTSIAGLILGSEQLGLEGIAPNAVLVPLVWYDKYPSGVVNNGGPQTLSACIIAAVDEYDCDILSISAGLPEPDETLRAAVAHAEARGALVVSAVGNDNVNTPDAVYYPASWETVIGVGAADGRAAAAFSQRHGVDLLAPGVGLMTPAVRSGVNRVDGTSYACAVASGVCALWVEREPDLDPAGLRALILSAASDLLEPGPDADSGHGLIMPPSPLPELSVDAQYAGASRRLCLAGLLLGGGPSPRDAGCARDMLAAALYGCALWADLLPSTVGAGFTVG